MIDVPPSFVAMPRWWDDEVGRVWLRDLPSLVHRQCRRWGLTVDGPVMHGSNALVVPVRRCDLELALRFTPPEDDVAAEVQALRTWAGTEVVRLFEVDEAAGAMLLERLDGGRSLATVPLQEAVEVLGALTRRLAIPVASSVKSTATIAREERARFEAEWDRLARPTPQSQLDAATQSADALAQEGSAATAVDGDLHFAQVLAARRAPWVVVDPVLLRGDAEYDLGRILWSRLDEAATDDAVLKLFDVFVSAAAVPAERAAKWVTVRAMSYLLWGLQRGLTYDPPRCRRLLDIFA